MGQLFFSPSGRIDSGTFLKAALILIVIGALTSLPSILGMDALASVMLLVSIALIYPWVAIWIKRYHDAGKSGWMCLLPIGIYVLLSIIAFFYLLWPMMAAGIELAAQGASEAEVEAAILEQGIDEEALTRQFTIASIVISLLVTFLFNALIKQDPGPNQFGPVPA